MSKISEESPTVVPSEEAAYAKFRFVIVRILIASIAVFSTIFFWYLVHCVWSEKVWTLTILQQHFAGIVSVPLASIGALCVVLVLRSTEGPMEFEGLGFKFKGGRRARRALGDVLHRYSPGHQGSLVGRW